MGHHPGYAHNDTENRHAKEHLVEQSLRQQDCITQSQQNKNMGREPAHHLVAEEQVRTQRAERVQ